MTPEAHANALVSLANLARSYVALSAAQLCEAHNRYRAQGRALDAHDMASNLVGLRTHVADCPALSTMLDTTVTALCPHLCEMGPDQEPPFYSL